MFAEERKNNILSKLEKNGKVKVNDLSKIYNVSEATIRRDLQELEEKNLLKRAHGGAVLKEHTKFEPTFSEKEDKSHDEKIAIGILGASLIEDGETIALDSGTTTLEIARNISAKNLTIVTNSLDIAYELGKKPDIEVIVTGGMVRWETQAMVGPIAESIISKFRVDKVFLGTNGLSLEEGFTTPNHLEANTKRTMMSISKNIIIVCDNTKFNQIAFSKIADLSEIDMVITDNKAPNDVLDKLKLMNLKVMVANT